MDKNGDTLYDQSLYYQYYWKSDTIKNGEPYNFKIVLLGHIFPAAHIEFNDYDSFYNRLSNANLEHGEMKNLKIEMQRTNYELGRNFIRGKIINYKPSGRKINMIEKGVEIYFSRSFYVKP